MLPRMEHPWDVSARENAPMKILLNGEPRTLAPAASIADLLQAEGLAERRVAVEVNGTIVPRGAHAAHALADGDKVEVVHALGGG
jgi:sulfur carrier protein